MPYKTQLSSVIKDTLTLHTHFTVLQTLKCFTTFLTCD